MKLGGLWCFGFFSFVFKSEGEEEEDRDILFKEP